MAVVKNKTNPPLDSRFTFAEDSFGRLAGGWDSHLRPAVGVADGEAYLLRLFKKTGTALDDDLRAIVTRGLRRIRRVLSSRRARDVLVEVLEAAEDQHELAIVMVAPGDPISGASQRRKTGRYLTSASRGVFWRNMLRVAEALALCHDAGIVHGGVSLHSIFSHRADSADYRLGGFEACVHISDGDLKQSGHLLRPSAAISFRQDWIDVAAVASALLGLDGENPPALLAIERRMLERLASPPQFQLFDGEVVLDELRNVVNELDRVGSSSEGELVLYPSRSVVQSDLPALSSGTIPATDTGAIVQFVSDDLLSVGVRLVPAGQDTARVMTDLAIYHVRIMSDTVGMIEGAHQRRPNEWMHGAVDIVHRLHLSRNRASAEERVQNLGPGAKRWRDLLEPVQSAGAIADVPIWFALILLEAFTVLREQFRLYPVNVLAPTNAEANVVWLAPGDDPERDAQRETMGLRPAAEALRRELKDDDGKANWMLSQTARLAMGRERAPELSYEGTGLINGKTAFAFGTNLSVQTGQRLFLRPRKDTGAERAIRRRLQNIVAARSNVELLRALDDPAQVAMDEVLRDIAAPGPPPADADMEQSKIEAWEAIADGRSINVVVGPPGVGKTFLISHLVNSVLHQTPDARILVSSQNHETLVHMEDELRKFLPATTTIIVRVERSRSGEKESTLRRSSQSLLRSVSKPDPASAAIMTNQLNQIVQALRPVDTSEQSLADRALRDTDNLMLRSSDVTLATTSSHILEEMIADGEQFDWVFIEEAARANGAELIGALLLGNRRVMIGDHNQLSPFDAADRQKFYDPSRAGELLRDAKEKLAAISDLPSEVEFALEALKADTFLLSDVLAIASRLEEPFKSIATREETRAADNGRPSSIANTLREQSRMHPAICELVSNTFYKRQLESSERVKARKAVVEAIEGFPTSPVVVLDVPSLSVVKRRAFEHTVKRSIRNEVEATALVAAIKKLRPIIHEGKPVPSLVVLSPYLAQVHHLERLLRPDIDMAAGTLFGFASPRGDGKFIYTSDSFQGGEADVVAASLVRNNVLVGTRALGFMKNPQRLNVLLSRAKHKLVLATSRQFILNAVEGTDPDGVKDELGFLRTMLDEVTRLSETDFPSVGKGASVVAVDEQGRLC
ncbi:AAA domain-containing protein [Breoghania corrubedonensis]|uniref:AAA domain-containing protein n=1 Tax=Breoghania corrubedonensis TaxID=665038 RepID=A0A2T5V9Z7_9HYPH|nr:AAA domain-containing protein [Breoghania corrubedonensis]PTW60577.1 AAA domain-containing protein [Breoghania corrubedonensis]